MIAETLTDITPGWLTEALGRHQNHGEVNRVSSEQVGNGQTALTYRLSLSWTEEGGGPDRIIVKLPPEDADKRVAAAFAYQQEVKFYRAVAPTVGVRAPRCLHADINEAGTSFTLLLEDMSPAEAGVQVRGAHLDEAERALVNVAHLHAARWNDPTLALADVTDWWGAKAEGVGLLQTYATESFIAYLGGQLADQDARTLTAAAQIAPRFLMTRPTPATVIHGDYRLENLLFHPHTGEVIAVDWQTMSLGPGSRDVAYFLATSLEPDLRQRHERRLLRRYHRELVAAGVTGYGPDACLEDYRLAQLWAAQIITIGALNAHEPQAGGAAEMFAVMARRACAAIRDLHALELVA
jgi:hypothetical protein